MTTKQIAFLLTVCAAPGLLAKGPATKQAAVTSTDRMSFAPGGTIRVNDSSGHVMVEGWDQSEVEITVVKSVPFGYDKDRAAKELEGVRINTEHVSPTELAISTVPSHRGKVVVDYQIHVPRDSRIVIHHIGGYVLVSHMSGEIEATCRRGDIVLMLPDAGPYSVDAKTKFGTILSDFEGDAHAQHVLGERFSSANPAGARRIYLRMGLGGITIKGLPTISEVSSTK
jgi:hypothetical protein